MEVTCILKKQPSFFAINLNLSGKICCRIIGCAQTAQGFNRTTLISGLDIIDLLLLTHRVTKQMSQKLFFKYYRNSLFTIFIVNLFMGRF